MSDLLDRRLLFVSGKGGVGKTTIAAALALLSAQGGRRTLVCEVDTKGALGSIYEHDYSGFAPREVMPNLWVMSMDTEDSLREYLTLNVRLPLVGRFGPLARALDFVATAAPGVREILTVGKICYEVRERNYDLVVVDASATGHIVGQLAAPQAISELVPMGLVRQQTGWMSDLLGDPAVTGLCIVATPEEMPVIESIELARRVKSETTVDLAAVIVNRVLPELFTRSEEALFEKLCEPEPAQLLAEAAAGDVGPLLAAARLAVTIRRTRAEHLDRLRAEIDQAVPMLYVPYLFARSSGQRSLRQVAAGLAAELGH